MWTRRLSRKGFSLLEVIICLGLIATALMAIFRLQARNLDLQAEARFITTAKLLCEERLARLGSDASMLSGSSSGDFGEDFPQYGYEEEVSPVSGVPYLYKVSIRIGLYDEERAGDYRMQTYVFRPGS
jgi:prepilin-type N-terminal cleavage/methylation domain-containing protein